MADLNAAERLTIVLVLHDLNLACRYAHNLVAMKDGRVVVEGPPSEVITEGTVAEVFGLESMVVPDPVCGSPMMVPWVATTAAPTRVPSPRPGPRNVACSGRRDDRNARRFGDGGGSALVVVEVAVVEDAVDPGGVEAPVAGHRHPLGGPARLFVAHVAPDLGDLAGLGAAERPPAVTGQVERPHGVDEGGAHAGRPAVAVDPVGGETGVVRHRRPMVGIGRLERGDGPRGRGSSSMTTAAAARPVSSATSRTAPTSAGGTKSTRGPQTPSGVPSGRSASRFDIPPSGPWSTTQNVTIERSGSQWRTV